MNRRETKRDRENRRNELLMRVQVLDLLIEDTRNELESLELYMIQRDELEESSVT